MPRRDDRPDSEVAARLRTIARRAKVLAVVRGALVTLAVAAAAVLLSMLIDASFTLYGHGVRTAVWAAGAAAVAAASYLTLWRPLRKRSEPAETARAIEAAHPGVDESLSTAIYLLDRDGATAGKGSLAASVLRDAGARAGDLRASHEAGARRVGPPLAALAVTGAIAAGVVAVWPAPAKRLFHRAVAPLSATGNAFSDTLVVRPGDAVVPSGESLLIEVEARPGTEVTLRRKVPGGGEAVERMAAHDPEAPGSYQLSIPAVDGAFDYRIAGGRALTRYYSVGVALRPAVVGARVAFRYPPHTGLTDTEIPISPEGITAPAGTTARLSATLAAPVERATLLVDGTPIWDHHQQLDGDGRPVVSWDFALPEGTDGSWRVQLEAADGLANEAADAPVRAIPDTPPTVEITSPAATASGLTVLPGDVLPIHFIAREDYGLSTAQLLVEADGRLLPPRELTPPPESAQKGTYASKVMLDLGTLAIQDGAVLNIRIGVADNNPDGPGAGLSEPLVLTVDRSSGSMLSQKITLDHAKLHEGIWSALEKLATAGKLAEKLPSTLLEPGEVSADSLASLAEIAELAAAAEGLVRDAAVNADAGVFADIAPALEAVARDQIAAARSAAESVPLEDGAPGRVHGARAAATQLEEATAELGEVLRDLKLGADREQIAAQLGEIEEQRRELAASGDDTSPLDRLTEELLKKSAQSLAERFADAGGLAETLAERAAALAEDQEDLAGLLELAGDLGAREQLVSELMRWLEEEQNGIAEKAAELARELGDNADLQKVAEAASRASAALAESLPADAARAAAESAAALEGMEKQGARPELEQLTDWQRRIAGQAAAFSAGDIEATLADMQGGLAELAAELAADSGGFEQIAQALADPDTAMRAVEALAKIAESAEFSVRAGEELAEGSPDFAAALEALAGSGENFEAAAESLSAAAATFARESRSPAAESGPAPLTPEAARERRDTLLASGWSAAGGGANGDLESVARGEPPVQYRAMVDRYFEAIAEMETPEGGEQ